QRLEGQGGKLGQPERRRDAVEERGDVEEGVVGRRVLARGEGAQTGKALAEALDASRDDLVEPGGDAEGGIGRPRVEKRGWSRQAHDQGEPQQDRGALPDRLHHALKAVHPHPATPATAARKLSGPMQPSRPGTRRSSPYSPTPSGA